MVKISKYKIFTKKNRTIAFIIHYVLKVVFLSVLPKISMKRKEKIDISESKKYKILIMRVDGLGDVTMSTNAFNAIREYFPGSHIVLLVAKWSQGLVEISPYFDDIIYMDLPWFTKEGISKYFEILKIVKQIRKEKYDIIFVLRGDLRNNILAYFLGAKYRIGYDITGCDYLLTHIVPLKENELHPTDMCKALIRYLNPANSKEYKLALWVTEEDKKYTKDILEKRSISDNDLVVMINPGSRWPGRQWTVDGYAAIADGLIDKYNARVIFTGSTKEIEFTEKIVNRMDNKPIILTGQTTIRQLLALLQKSVIFLGVDSGPAHMSAVMGINTVVLFGPALPKIIGPRGDNVKIVKTREIFECSPCHQVKCKYPEYNCMMSIKVDDVWLAVENMLKKA